MWSALFAALLFAQAPVNFPIKSIRVEGSLLFSQEKLVQATGLKIGDPGTPDRFEAAKDRLIQSNAFGSVGYRYEPSSDGRGYAVTYEVADIEQLYPFRFERLQADDHALRAHLKQRFPLFEDRIPGSRELMDRYREAISAFLNNAPITARLTGDRPDQLYIMFHPSGTPPVVAEVDFRGNDVIPTTVLQLAIHGVAVGIEYRESRFRELLGTSVRPLYEARGRVAVDFPKIQAEPVSSVKGLKITVDVVEGPTYSFGHITVEGTHTLNEELVNVAGLKEDDLANFDQVREAQQRIHLAMRRNGYMKVASSFERKLDDRKKTVDLTFHVTPGPEYRFGKLFIKGLDLHAEHEMRRIWGMQADQLFNADYPDFFLNRLREDQILENLGENTRSRLAVDEKTLKVDVTLEFAPEPPQEKKRPGQPD
ncbi:MAG: hypothetical protein FJW20_06915 [Acidimicrobiia bacterium]|nr:hypothetical protein [Acidimicrobiia bacterium]